MGPRSGLLCLACALSACAGGGVRGPDAALRAYLAAAQNGDASAAYALLDDDTQDAVTLEEFSDSMQENEAELREQAVLVGQTLDEEGIRSRAEVHLDSGEAAVLTIEEGNWKISGGVLDAPALLTPRDSVLALRHALQRRDLNALLRVLARPTRADLEADIRSFLEATIDLLDLRVEVQGDRARVQTSSGFIIQLTREAGEWRILEVE